MVPEQSRPEVREAIEELQLYLSDVLPPLVVADAFKLLLSFPASLIASNIESWTAARYRPGSVIKISDYIFYAVKKVFLIGEFRLVPRDPFQRFFEELKTLVLGFCPEAERETLRRNMDLLGKSTEQVSSSVDALIRQRSEEGVPAVSSESLLTPEEIRGLRRFSLLLERLVQRVPEEGVSEAGAASDPLGQALTTAALTSRRPEDFEQNLDRLRELGLEVETADIFRALAASLPGWGPLGPPPPESGDAAGTGGKSGEDSATLEAMRRIIAQPEDPGEVARRFHEMVKAACERFNEGALPQAATILELADRIAGEKGVDASTVEAIRHHGDDALDIERLRRYAETQRDQRVLPRVLNFFAATRPKGLLVDLLREMKRERRKLILQLLEVHGAPARREALDRLRSAFGQGEGDERWYFRRNLLYLLRRIPPPVGVPPEEDIDTAIRHAVLHFPAPLVKEAVANLGQLKHERAESTLIKLLEDLEKMLVKPASSPYDPREIRLLLDRVVAALARFGTANARRAVVEHGLKKKAELGDTVARLSELAGQDLSGDNEAVERLLAALKANSPHKLLGIVMHHNDSNARHLIEALSTTPAPPVKAAFEDLAKRFPNLDVGKVAAKALAALEGSAQAPESTYDTRSGDVDLFGLPALIQNLAESGATGLLTLRDSTGEMAAEIFLKTGKMKACEARGLTGEQAFYQLLERPTGATFVFERRPPDGREETAADSLLEILPLCLEGMRRYDEFQQTVALVPDDAKLKPTAVRPDPHPDEIDGIFVNGLWNLVSGGATPRECEGALKADSFRVRRQLARWVETGALRISD